MRMPRKIAKARKEVETAHNRWRFDSAVIAARAALQAAEANAQRLYRKEIEEKEAFLRALESQFAEERRREASTMPPRVAEFLRRIKKGTDWGVKEFKVRWISEDRRLFIFTRRSHTYWNGIGAPRAFAPTRHSLINLCQMPPEPKMESGLDLYLKCKIREHEGRLTGRTLEDMMQSAERAQRSADSAEKPARS